MWEQVLELTPEYDPKILRRYAPASKEVYGEVNPVLVSDFIKALKLSSQDVLYDLGSGVGNVAAQTGCVAVGVEIRSELTSIGQALLKNYQTLLRRAHLLRGEVQLVCGDILSPEVDLSKATVVFLNNYCFPQHLEQSVLKKFKAGLKNGVRIITLKDFAPRFRPTSTRFVKSYCHLFKFPWLKCADLLASLELPLLSWTDKSVDYFIYQVDRNNLARQKAFKEAAKKGLRLSDNLVCSLKDGEIVVEAVAPPAAKGKGNESEENSDVEIGALMQAEFRGDSAKHLLHVLRGGHELTQMLKSLGCDTAKLEASNRRAGEKLKEAELNGDLDRADGARPRKTARKGQHSSRSSTASSASSSTSPAVVLVAADDSFEELMERFATWQAETRKKDSKRGRKVKLSKPDDQRETPVTLAALNDELKRWEKEVKLSKKRSTPHNVSTSGGSEWKALAADFAKWKRQHDTRQHSHSPSSAPDDPKTGVAAAVEPVAEPSKSSSLWDQAPPTTGSTPVMEYSLPPGWVRKIRCEPGGRRRYKFISPTGRVFVSLKSAREHIDKERISRKCSGDTSDSSPATTPPTPRRYAKRRSDELRKLATAPNKKQREPKEEKEEEDKEEKHDDDDNGDKDEDGATSQDSNKSMEAKTNEEVEAGERRQGHHTPNNENGQLPEGWRRRKRGRYWTYTSPGGTLYRSRKQALLAVSGQSGVQIDSEEQQQEESEKKGEEDKNSKVGQAASDEGCVQTTTTPKKRRLARRSAPAALERKRKQDMQREVEAKEAQEERSRQAWDTHEDRCDRANIRRRVSNPGRGSSSSSSREPDENVIIINGGEEEEEVEGKEEEEKKEAEEEEKRPQKRSRRQRELDRLRGWDQWREEEQKRKEELQRRIRERRSSSSTRSGDDN